MKKITILFLILSLSMGFLFINFKASENIEVHASGPKKFEVGDVLPATTQLAIYSSKSFSYDWDYTDVIATTSLFLYIEYFEGYVHFKVNGESIFVDTYFPLSDNPIIINTSNWTESQRTVTNVTIEEDDKLINLVWEDLNAPTGYSITFEENGGSTVTDLTEQTALPDPLPTSTKEGYTFLGWYYDSELSEKAYANDSITDDTILYAAWIASNWYIHSPQLLALTHPEEDASEYWDIVFKSGSITFNRIYIEYLRSGPTYFQYHYGSGSVVDICILDGDDILYLNSSYLNIEIISGDTTSPTTLITLLELIASPQIPEEYYTITFVSNGGTPFPDRYVVDRLTQLPIPERANSRFTGWYYDSELSQRANNGDLISDDTVLYAGWILNSIYEDLTEARFYQGYSTGYDDGYDAGFKEGEGSAWEEAYEEGFRDALEIASGDIQDAWNEGYEFAKESFGFQKDGKYYDGKSAYMLGYNDNDNLRKLFIPALVIIFVATIILSGINVFRKRD